ncbi:hypothetical protein CPB84DRAFT_1762452 [Gymnopilus junonius]|uniref:F-box domain-containing protein n=1 Tax=Gymnopilus junonius TaxID=109634 RepID=A0A9P5P0N1_GYMJU|nr:hypothetical protein CPB84DRAFT_1762452 [Gymnopilus junonius]
MSVAALPQELVRLIMEYLENERATLHALACTCKHVHLEVMRVLYRSMTDPDGTRSYKFLLKIRKYRHLAQLVRVYRSPDTTNTSRGSLWGLIRRCLPLMNNLKELDLLRLTGNPLKLLPSLPKGQALPFQLQKLYICSNGHEEEVTRLLETQHELKYLDLGSSARELKLSHEACPNLRTLHAYVKLARNILQGRQVIELDLKIGQIGHNSFYLEEMTRSLSEFEATHVRSLSIDNFFSRWWNDLDARGIKPFPNVELLQARETCISHISQIAPDLTKFPRLKQLVLSPSRPILPERYDEICAGVSLYLTKHLNLKYIDIFWDKPRLYQRWVDGVLQPGLIDYAQVFNPQGLGIDFLSNY